MWGIEQLSPILFDEANTDARTLLAHVMGVERGMLTVKLQDHVNHKISTCFQKAIEQRITRQPVAQIIGYREFWGRKFKVTPDVLAKITGLSVLGFTKLTTPLPFVLITKPAVPSAAGIS